VIGISGFSNVLTWWRQGGPIAIHGTNQPWSIGQAVSNGCVRVRNDVLRRLFRQAIAGTPVIIHP
jgi:lipoprotein-anchoring transpeptidase ErfK/SrfK